MDEIENENENEIETVTKLKYRCLSIFELYTADKYRTFINNFVDFKTKEE